MEILNGGCGEVVGTSFGPASSGYSAEVYDAVLSTGRLGLGVRM